MLNLFLQLNSVGLTLFWGSLLPHSEVLQDAFQLRPWAHSACLLLYLQGHTATNAPSRIIEYCFRPKPAIRMDMGNYRSVSLLIISLKFCGSRLRRQARVLAAERNRFIH